MNLKTNIKKLSIAALLVLTAIPACGQDLLAREAPVDRKMRAVDTVATRYYIIKENRENPAADLYADFSNQYAHRATPLPDHFKIDLRGFCMPTPSRVITSNFQYRWGRMHKGLDIKVYIGDTIRAAFAGKVRVVRYERGGYGHYIVIRHNNGLETIYGHLSKQLVSENQYVKAGEPIALGGNSGRSTGSHLHFETRLCGVALNPALMFDFRNQDVVADYYIYNKDTYQAESAEATRLRGKRGNGSYSRSDVYGNSEVASTKQEETLEKEFGGQNMYHKVKSGETLESIARNRGVSVDQICKLNHLTKSANIRPGMILRYS
ncbi:MAG: M23 family metallopeptidase [Prevotella sp.]|jgi:murein DD-endopeptidase MepM/ murein hydrolase activator NlpD|nr:M23 family metallopeptidase [Prevotella sp.]MCH3995235.1 M23 family metallopeptidase [Prevotella sp.]